MNTVSPIWAIAERALPDLESALRAARANPDLRRQGADLRNSPRAQQRGGDVVSLPLFGVLDAHPSWILGFMGGTSTIEFGAAFDRVMSMPSVSTIVLEVNSPGGSISGTPELADKIYNARGRGKQIIAHVNTFAASAAFWLASQADRIVLTPSGDVGSIGVYVMLQDWTKALDQEGVKITFIRQPPGKANINPYESLPESARAQLQTSVNSTYQDFLSAVARGRGVSRAKVAADYGQGSMVDARDALRKGMVDAIQPFDSMLSGILTAAARKALDTAERQAALAELRVDQAARASNNRYQREFADRELSEANKRLVEARRRYSDLYLRGSASPTVLELRRQHEQRKREAARN